MVIQMDEGNPESGVIYITSGAFHTAAAVAAARSVRETNPWLAIDLYTDEPKADGPFDRVVEFSGGVFGGPSILTQIQGWLPT